MKRFLIAAVAGVSLLLGGCATTVTSQVTTFHQWPAAMADKTYVFEAPPAQDDTLEYRSYQNMVRGELTRLGFQDAGASGKPTLAVSMRYMTTDVPVRVITVAPPYFYDPFGFPYRPGRWRGWYSPFYDPFWYGPRYDDRIEHQFRRELQVSIKSIPDNKHLYDVTVHNMSRTASTPVIMPALVRSAFEGFPGPNGQARIVELKLDDK
jgi:hypothetical protein